MYLLLRWLLNTLALFVMAYIVPNFYYRDGIALAIAALLPGLLNAIVPGFDINGFGWAIVGAIVLALVSLVTNRIGTVAVAERRGE